MKVDDRTATIERKRPQFSGPQWEYRSVKADVEDSDWTQYGQDGWELVSVVPIPYDPGQAVYTFKRRRG